MGRRNDAQPYFAAANNLRSSIMRNREDARFAAQDGEIIYIFDTNVFIFHSDLNDGNKISRDFYTLIGRGGSDPLARTIERLTADFLFSCRLPGQRRAGFISVPHLEEVLLQTQRIAKKLKSGGRGVEVDLKEIQRHEIRSILQSNITTETKLKRLGQVLPAAWMSNLNAKAHFTRAVRSAFLEPERTLVPLDREAWGREAAQFTMAEVNEWSKVLPSSNQREPKAIEDDALTLQLIVNLIKKSSLDRRVKFVFVTADDKLERAVNARASELGIENFVRSPRDYLPLINFKSMFNALGRDEIDSDLGKQFEVLFDKFNDALDWITIPQEHALDSDRTWSDNMKSIREAWIAASESATVINAHHISDGGDDIFAHVAEFVEDTGEGAVAALVDKSVEELRRRHVAIVLDSAISDLSLVRRGQNNRIARRVGLQLIGVTLGNLIGDVTLNDFLDSLIVPGKLPEATSRAINERPESYEAQLLACAIFVAAERWSAGIDFGWRAWREAKGKKGHRRSEAAYLVALCLRFSMQDPYHLRRAVELLESNLTLYNREREPGLQALLRRLRDTMELGNLLLSASVTQELASSPIGKTVLRGKRLGLFQGTSSQTQFEAGVRHLSAARLELLESEGGIAAGGSNSDALYAVQRWLKVMSATNLIGAFVFERTVLRLQSMRPSVVSCKEELDELEAEISRKERMDEPVRPTQVIYRHAARALMANHIDDRKQALGALKSALEMFLRDDKRLPLADRLEFLHLKDWLLLQEDLDFAN